MEDKELKIIKLKAEVFDLIAQRDQLQNIMNQKLSELQQLSIFKEEGVKLPRPEERRGGLSVMNS